MIWSKIKLYVYSAIGLLVAGLAVAVKFLSAKNSRLERKVKTTDARIEHAKAVIRADKEAEEQADIRIIEAKREIDEAGVSDELADPNDDW